MIKSIEIDLKAMETAELETQQFGHSIMVDYHLSQLPRTDEGMVDISRLTEGAGNDLISPITRFQRLVNTQTRLNEIREELANRETKQ